MRPPLFLALIPMASLRNLALVAGGCAAATACQSPAERVSIAVPPATSPVAVATPPALAQPVSRLAAADRTTPEATSLQAAALARTRLRALYKSDLEKNLIPASSRQFMLATHDLNADGQPELFIGLSGPYFCGSGGCTWLLLTPKGTLITSFSVSRYPVVVSNTRTSGWSDLLVESHSYYHRLQFNGKAYPSNPSIQPVLHKTPSVELPRLLKASAAVVGLSF